MQPSCGTNVFGEFGEKAKDWWRGVTAVTRHEQLNVAESSRSAWGEHFFS